MRRSFLLLAVSSVAALWRLPTRAAEPSAHYLLVGTWRHQTFKQYADGKLFRAYDSHDESTMQYKIDGTWVFVSPRQSSSGTYRWLDGARIETTIVQSELAAQIGFVGIKQVQFDSRFLKVTVLYDEIGMKAFQPKADGTRPNEMMVVSTFERAPAE